MTGNAITHTDTKPQAQPNPTCLLTRYKSDKHKSHADVFQNKHNTTNDNADSSNRDDNNIDK